MSTTLGEGLISLLAIDNKRSPVKFPMTAIASDGSNFLAQTGLVTTLATAIAGISDCTIASEAVGNVIDEAASLPTVNNAIRSSKISFQVKDTVTGKIRTRTIAGPKTTLTRLAGKTDLVITASPFSTFVTDYQAVALSDDGNALTIVGARLTGRTLD